MSAVFLANRDDDQFRKNVAFKILRFDTDEPAARARFRNERQILAALDHPHIAALYDGGTIDEGMPYIVMEYVEASPLTNTARPATSPFTIGSSCSAVSAMPCSSRIRS